MKKLFIILFVFFSGCVSVQKNTSNEFEKITQEFIQRIEQCKI